MTQPWFLGRLTIQGRLFAILALAAAAVMVASIVAMLAMTDIRTEFEGVVDRDLPETTAALRIAQIGERLQGRASALVAATVPEERREQATLIDIDVAALSSEAANLRGIEGGSAVLVAEISDAARALQGTLNSLAQTLAARSATTKRRIAAVTEVLALQDDFKQIIGPSVLAITDAVRRGPVAGEMSTSRVTDDGRSASTFVRAVAAQGPLLEGERLVDVAINALLIASEAPDEETLSGVTTALARMRHQWTSLLPAMPAGLRPPLSAAVSKLEQYADPATGFPALRRDELHASATAEALIAENRRFADTLSSRVDRLVAAADQSVVSAASGVRSTIVGHTAALALLSIAAVAAAALLSYFFVIRDLGSGMRGVTTAMSRLAHGERDVPVPATGRPDEIGDLARAFLVFRDNARRMDALDRQLLEKSNLLLATFDNMNDGFTVFDSEARLLAWNPQYVRLYDFALDELTPETQLAVILEWLVRRGAIFHTPLGAAASPKDLAEVGAGEVRSHEARLPSGRILELRTNPIPTGGFVTIHTDVTERKAIEAQLRQAQKMEVVGQLSGGLAHDFNNMLAVIQGNLHLLHEALLNQDDLRERVIRALAASDRAAMQIERLLAVSRRQKLSPEAVDINDLVAGMVDLLDYSVGNAVDIRTDLANDLPSIFVDPGQLENAVLNLAVNARDAMTAGGSIAIATRLRPSLPRRPDTGTFVELAVSDTGCGIDPETVDRVFEPFFSTKETGKGSGLGLSMVYGFVRQSGGDVLIDSVPGEGTTVRLSLPVAQRGRETEETRDAQAFAHGSIGGCVLVVEDDPDLRKVTENRLRDFGCSVIAAANADEALARLHDNPRVNLIFTDVMLGPGANGFELAELARAERPALPVIFTSGGLAEALARLSGYEPHAEILQKPVSPEILAKALGQALGCSNRLHVCIEDVTCATLRSDE